MWCYLHISAHYKVTWCYLHLSAHYKVTLCLPSFVSTLQDNVVLVPVFTFTFVGTLQGDVMIVSVFTYTLRQTTPCLAAFPSPVPEGSRHPISTATEPLSFAIKKEITSHLALVSCSELE